MYAATDDPYCYSGTSILKNRLGLRDPAALTAFEAMITAQRADEPLPTGGFDEDHYRAIHRHLFQDVYDWAGEIRTVRIGREGSWFCYPEYIETEMRRVFGELADENLLRDFTAEDFARKAAHFLSELNAIHPFREGNGRTQNSFLFMLADHAGHPMGRDRLEPDRILRAMIASFGGDEGLLAGVIRDMVRTTR